MSGQQHRAGQRGDGAPGPERPRWPLLLTGGLAYAGALLGIWIVLAGQPDVQDLAAGSGAALLATGVGYVLSERGRMVPGARAADLRALAALPWRVTAESGQVLALAARKAAGRRVTPGAFRAIPLDEGPPGAGSPDTNLDARSWAAARREAMLTALLSAAPGTVVVDIDVQGGTALVHQLGGAPRRDESSLACPG